MSRVAGGGAAADQAISIYRVAIKTPNRQWTTYRTYQAGDDGFLIGEGVFFILRLLLLNCARAKLMTRAGKLGDNDPARISIENNVEPLTPLSKRREKLDEPFIAAPIIWINILNIALGFGPSNSLATLRQAAVAHLLSRNQLNLLRPKAASLFPVIPIHPNQLIEAILHGDEKMACDMLTAAPELLLKEGRAMDYQGRSFTGTALQAAIATFDVAPNTNSTGMVEIIVERLKQFKPDDYQTLFTQQARYIYEKSLIAYIQMQEEMIVHLRKFAGESAENPAEQTDVNAKIKQAQTNLHAYAEALRSDDLNALFETHNKAQADNAFDFQPPYVDAIINATQAELDDVMALINAKTPEETAAAIARTGVACAQTDEARAKPFDQLTLVQKLNRFREEFVAHTGKEIIFNPNHILSGLKSNETIWNTLPHDADTDYHKRTVIFSQLVGWAQRNAAEPVKQDIRQGAWYLTEENEARRHQSRFNDLDQSYKVVRNSFVDVSIIDSSVVDGVGYKFGVQAGRAHLVRAFGATRSRGFQNLCLTKTASFQNLLRRECNRPTVA